MKRMCVRPSVRGAETIRRSETILRVANVVYANLFSLPDVFFIMHFCTKNTRFMAFGLVY